MLETKAEVEASVDWSRQSDKAALQFRAAAISRLVTVLGQSFASFDRWRCIECIDP